MMDSMTDREWASCLRQIEKRDLDDDAYEFVTHLSALSLDLWKDEDKHKLCRMWYYFHKEKSE